MAESKFHVGINIGSKKREDDEKARIAANILKYIQEFGWGEQGRGAPGQGAEAQFGSKQMYDFYKYMFGTEPPQRTLESPTGGMRTERVWPGATSEEMLTGGVRDVLSKPGAAASVAKGKLGMGSPWEKIQAEVTKHARTAELVKGAITSGLNVVTPQGGTRPLTGPEAISYFAGMLEGKTPDLPIAPPTSESSQWMWKQQLAQTMNELGLYGKAYDTLTPDQQGIANMASTFGAASIADGMIQAPGTTDTGEPFKEERVPLAGGMVQKQRVYTKGPKKGQTEKIGVPYSMRAEAGGKEGLNKEDYARYDLQIKDDAYKAATRELMSRGQMRLVQDPMNPGSMTIQFAVPADQGSKLLRDAYSQAYRELVRSAKQNGYLPTEWSEEPYGEGLESPSMNMEDFGPKFNEWFNKFGEGKFGSKSGTQPVEKKEGKTIGRFKLND